MATTRTSVSSARPLNDHTEQCLICKIIVKDNDDGVECDYCHGWTHAKCAGLSSAAYKSLSNVTGFKFFCKQCTPSIDRLLAVEHRLDDHEARFEELTRKMESFTAKLSNVPRVSNDKPFSDTPSQKSFTEAVDEAVELKLKRHNAVLFGLPESDDDIDAIREMVTNANPRDRSSRIRPSDILYTFRDGPSINGKPRFNKVVCATNQVRDNFIKLINRTIKPDLDLPLRARPDLTFRQRQEGRQLREKLKELDTDCTDDFSINYARRAIFSKKSRSFVFSLDAKAEH
jgi:PHD-finger